MAGSLAAYLPCSAGVPDCNGKQGISRPHGPHVTAELASDGCEGSFLRWLVLSQEGPSLTVVLLLAGVFACVFGSVH